MNRSSYLAAGIALVTAVAIGLLLRACLGDGPRCGYIDTQGQWVIKPQFRFAEPFVGGMAPAPID